jgi:sugar phosphate isomerase/epimerase
MEYVVKGVIDWEGQLQALITSGYDGYLSIETHCRPKVESAQDTLRRILAVAGDSAL